MTQTPRPQPATLPLSLALGLHLLLTGISVHAQNLLPNPGFEDGTQQPTGWHPSGAGSWTPAAPNHGRSLLVPGAATNASQWQTDPLPLKAGQIYAFRFRGRRDPTATGGTGVAGTSRVHRDFPLTADWREYAFCLRHPDDPTPAFAGLGHWEVQGNLTFDDASLLPVIALHQRSAGGIELGEAESIRNQTYRFQPRFGWPGANAHRPLLRHRGGFNSDRILFSEGSELLYRFAVPGAAQLAARLNVSLNYHESGSVQLAASRDGTRWTSLGSLDGARRSGQFGLPESLLPAPEVYVRLSMPEPGSAQVNQIDYEARLASPQPDVEGATQFLEIEETSPALRVDVESVRLNAVTGLWETRLNLTNLTGQPLALRASLSSEHSTPSRVARLTLAPDRPQSLTLSVPTRQPGPAGLFLLIRNTQHELLFSGRTDVRVPAFNDMRPGYWLAQTNGLALWWAEAGWKIGRDRGAPPTPRNRQPQPITLAAAQGESESFQLVLRPAQDAQLTAARLDTLSDPAGQPSTLTARFHEVAYVTVTQPTDDSSAPGDYPDPLPPLSLPLALAANQNQPLWITLRVPPGSPAGEHRGRLLLETSRGSQSLPFTVRVRNFELPREPRLRSAFGLISSTLNQYHRLQQPSDREATFNRYLQNFADHRISPYSFYDFAPIDVQFPETNGQKVARVDFDRFDRAAARWLDEAGFTTFQLPLLGMGGGTFHSRHPGELAGYPEGSPEHTRLFNDYLGQVERHLRERGWLAKAFTYWFDEPDPKDYAFVVEGMKRLHTAAPGIRRMLTEQPEPDLLGHVDIWCALTPEWTPQKVQARRDAGEEVWWYICTAPKAPYVSAFIDRPATELRLWPWQSWQHGVTGILIWSTVYWHSPAAYPDPALQDPWTDPMSWVSGYGFQPGQRSPWGNGDGRLLYPPRPNPTQPGPLLEDPVNSIRWENLRDGMEDYDYLWLLQDRLRQAERTPGQVPANVLDRARALLTVPPDITVDLTHFTTDPRPILQHRDRLAAMIEQLDRSLKTAP